MRELLYFGELFLKTLTAHYLVDSVLLKRLCAVGKAKMLNGSLSLTYVSSHNSDLEVPHRASVHAVRSAAGAERMKRGDEP